MSDKIELFVHTPFRSDTQDGSRNSTSLGMQVMLINGSCRQRFLLLGDLEHEQVEAFFERSAKENSDRLDWDFLLAPHHGSRCAIRRQDGDKWVDADAYIYLEDRHADGAAVIVSSRSFADVTGDDTNPPHKDAREAYERMVGKSKVWWTADAATGSGSEPITVIVEEGRCGERRTSKRNGGRRWRASRCQPERASGRVTSGPVPATASSHSGGPPLERRTRRHPSRLRAGPGSPRLRPRCQHGWTGPITVPSAGGGEEEAGTARAARRLSVLVAACLPCPPARRLRLAPAAAGAVCLWRREDALDRPWETVDGLSAGFGCGMSGRGTAGPVMRATSTSSASSPTTPTTACHLRCTIRTDR